MEISLGISPCPNDTFIFDALIHQLIDTQGLNFNVTHADVEQLNKWANEEILQVTKLSFPALFKNSNTYRLLNSGSALGNGVGPLLISKKPGVTINDVLDNDSIAIPGKNTTANLLLQYALPTAGKKTEVLFSEIEESVISGKFDFGVIIHESRFTYQQKGLYKVVDLGNYWEEKKQLPIPLGCIAAHKNLEDALVNKIENLITQSVQFAFNRYPELSDYIITHAQEMDEAVMRNHIELYVNDYSINLGAAGNAAVNALQDEYFKVV